MSVEVAVVGSPYLDLVFAGLPRLPSAGEEIVGEALHLVPGGSAIQAIGAARLGLSSALVGPKAADLGGRLLEEALDRESVRWVGPAADRTATTAVLSAAEGVGMATAPGDGEVTSEEVARVDPARVILPLGRAGLRPPGIPACFVTGSIEIDAGVRTPIGPGVEGDVLVVTALEAVALTGEGQVDAAARALALRCGTAVVTRGGDGAVGVSGDRIVHVPAAEVDAVDATGAGDLFVAALVWAELRGLPLRRALEWACLYAGLSVGSSTALDGALHLDDLVEEGRRRGLSPP